MGNKSLKTPEKPEWSGNPAWLEALRIELERGPRGDASVLFHEEREDASVEWSSGSVFPTVDRTRTAGLAFDDGAGTMRFLAEPCPAAVAAVTRNVGLAGPPSPPVEDSPPDLAVAEAIVAIESLAAAAEKRLKDAGIRARWVGFDQRVHVARVGRPVVADQRRSGRLRLEISLVRKGRSARAVGESVAHLDRASPAQGLVEQLAEAVATRAEQRLAAEAVPSGERPVVFAPGVGGVLFHELVGHALEADTVRRRASWLACGNQEYRAAAELMVLDDPRRCRVADEAVKVVHNE